LDGKRAFEIYEMYYPDIIITDIGLQFISGFELITKIRDKQSVIDNYIIAVSSEDEIADESLALRLGANNFLRKPIEPIKLINYFNIAINTITSVLELKFEKFLLEQNTCIDNLTGLANSGYLFRRYREELAKAYRYKRKLSCMRLNFDEFEIMKSRFGERASDDILKLGTRLIKNNLRKGDVIGRIERSELGIMLPETNISGANIVGKKLQDAITKTKFITNSDTVHITLSIGISSNESQKDETDSIFDKAEKALNEARLIGPNSLVINSST
jgi:diguanylate cyclase (GGDEF)-like protein